MTRRSPGRNARPATARGRRRRLRRRRRRRSRGRGRRRFGRPGAGAGGPARVARAGGLARSAGGAGRCRFAGVRSLASAGRAGTAGVSPRIGAGRSGAAIGPTSGRRSRRVAGVPGGVVAARLPGAGVPRSRSRGPRGDGIGDDRAYGLVGADPGRSGDQRHRHQLERRRAGQRGAPHDHSGGADGAPRAARADAGTTPEDLLEHGRSGERRERGCEQGECGPAAADRLLEVLARLAGTEVGANFAPTQQAQVVRGDPFAHEVAAHLVAIPQLVQGGACLIDELLAAGLRRGERGCDRGVAEAAQLSHDDRAALPIGERGEIGHERAKLLAGLRVVGEGRRGRGIGGSLTSAASDDRDRLVVGDPEQPGLEGALDRARAER